MSRPFAIGGVIASLILVAIGVGSIVVGAGGRGEIRDNLRLERITGTPDMTPSLTAEAARKAGLRGVTPPDCSVAGKPIDSGARARCFAQYMRVHALEATGGQVYAQMPRYVDARGRPTNDEAAAAKDKTGAPVSNAARNVWVTETALSNALNTSYIAEQVALFSIVIGVAMALSGIGFLVLTTSLLRRTTQRPVA